MNETMLKTLVEIMLSQLYQLETATDDDVNEDFSVKLMEQSAAYLQSLSVDEARKFLEIVNAMAELETDENHKEYLQDFGDNFGITDILV